MKFNWSLILALLVSLIPSRTIAAGDVIEKTFCIQAINYESLDKLKTDLLTNAKRLAVNELFGELITASTAVENFVVTSDQIRASSIGFIRLEGMIDYHNGANLAEVCVTIRAYATEQDREKFNPVKLTKRHCATNADLTTRELADFAKEEVIIQSLLDYDRRLEQKDRNDLLHLMHRVNYLESGFIPDTETYCARVEGYLVPIEIITLLEPENTATTGAHPATCRDILIQDPNAKDDYYTLYLNGEIDQPFNIFCFGMRFIPGEYLPFVNIGDEYNFSKFPAGGATTGTDVVTQFKMVRIDLQTMTIDPKDLTFAQSKGGFVRSVGNAPSLTTVDYAYAASCLADYDSSGAANIDLRGTPFAIDSSVTFQLFGWRMQGETTISHNRQVVNLTGGGWCGGTQPTTPIKVEYILPPTNAPANKSSPANTPVTSPKFSILEEVLQLDTFNNGNNIISSKTTLLAGEGYLIVISGTYSLWHGYVWSALCNKGGIPENQPQTPSPGKANGKVGVDAEYMFAYPDAYSNCQNLAPAPLPFHPLLISLDGGHTWISPSPVDTNYKSDHIYEYRLKGQGFPFLVRQNDDNLDDNYGILTFTIQGLLTKAE